MATQTTTTTLDTSQGQGTLPAGVPDGSIPRDSSGGSGGSDAHTNASSTDLLPKPNNQLSAEKIEEQEFDVTLIADEDEKIFDEEFHNEDHLLQKYWTLLKQILETPCDQRVEAYQNLNRRIGGLKPAPRYQPMRDVLLQWARGGFVGDPKIVFIDPNGNEYSEPKTEKDSSWEQRGHDKDKTQPTEDVILPTDMEYFITLYNDEATPLIEQIFNKPKLAQQEPGQKLAAVNDEIKARVAKEQEQMMNRKDPLVINVNLEVPIRQLLHLMIRGTNELVRCNKEKVGEIADSNTVSAYKMLERQLGRAKQPSIWHQSLGVLVEAKAVRWRQHIAAQSDLTADENLWDDDFEAFVLGRAPDPEHIKRYYDGRNAPGTLADGQADADSNTHGQGQSPGNVESNDVKMSDGSQEEASSDEVVLPTDMSWYVAKWEEATTSIGNLLHEPRLIRQEPGKQMEALNNDILGQVTNDQEQGVNVDLQVPAMELLRVLMMSTAALVDSGKHEVDEIEDPETTAAFNQLKLRLKLAKQPQPWEDKLKEAIKLKVQAWTENIAAGTQPGDDKHLWDEDLKDFVCEAAHKPSDATQADVFADPENKDGKIGGFRVASRKRDGTEHYQVLVQVGVYGEAQRVQGTLWHINAASMYRDTIVEDYRKGGGTQITSLDGGVGELREHDLSRVRISGIAVIPRTTAKGYKKMPTMFIQGAVDDGKGPRFWSRTYMGRVWGQNAVIRKIRDFTASTGMPVLTNDAQQPSLLMPEGASKRTCKAWGVAYVGRVEESTRGEGTTNDRDGDLDRNDGVYDKDDGFVVHDEEQPLDPTSEEFRKADKKRRMEELEVELVRLKESMKEDA